MNLTIAAILSGTDPIGPLPEASFHRTLEDQISCPKCHLAYNLVVDYDRATGRFFEDESRPLIMLLRKAIFLGHGDGHRVTHFETSGVVVKRYSVQPAPIPAT
ncbi:hypothetical protein FTO74_11615 [Granulicella sp. WH15]|uniref:hypothetical protein n=1 Tax=Granulicella sp. WH15 TaxID=2602070 RepID=UPI001366DD4D|nr:hypothetical protein [Granulicella sp. WH15]QHN03946.1 hypothetical protein FTO74_11615 [Granulicella sp. WH15]